EAELLRRQQRVEHSRASLNDLIAEYSDLQSQRIGSSVERLEDVEAVRDRLEQFAGTVCQEQLSFVRKPVTEDSQQAARPVDEETLARAATRRTGRGESVRRDSPPMRHA